MAELIPGQEREVAAEYRQTCDRAGLFDQSQRGKVELTGPDAIAFLHNLCSNDIQGLSAGRGCEAFLTTAKAKVVSYAWIFCHQGQDNLKVLWLDLDPGQSATVVQHLNKYLISEQVTITDRTKEFAQLHLAGPKATSAVSQLTKLAQVIGRVNESTLMQDFEEWPTSASEGLERWHIRRVIRLSVPGFDILGPAQETDRVWQALIEAGARPAGQEAFEILRLEAGTPVYGIDIDETVIAPEVGRTDKAISYSKGCYLGQETIVRTRDLGHVNRSLLGLKIAGDKAVPPGSKLFCQGKEVGKVTSSVLSPRLGTAIALAYIHRGCQEPGTKVDVQTPDGLRTGEVSPLPFIGLSGS